jgi:enoyl-CoA hydratase/carnithine racemase
VPLRFPVLDGRHQKEAAGSCAEEALAAGIINRVAPEGCHLETTYEFAAELAKNPPLSVRATVRTRRW